MPPKPIRNGAIGMSPAISFRDRRAALLVDLADEHQRQVHLLRLDEPQPSAIAAKCLDHPLLLAGDREPRRIGELDGGEETQM